MRSVNRLLQIYRNKMDIPFDGHEYVNPSKHLNHFGLHFNYLIIPILTVNFLNVLINLDSQQKLKSKGSNNFDKKIKQK